MAGNSLDIRHLREVSLHHELLLPVMRIDIDLYLGVIHKQLIVVGKHQWVDLNNLCISLQEQIVQVLKDKSKLTFFAIDA
jgi:hypothetical protein